MLSRRAVALVRCALVAVGLGSVVPAVARAQDVLCDPNEREVRHVRFQGNVTFSDDELSARVLSTPSSRGYNLIHSTIFGARRCFPDIGLTNDVLNLRAFYENYGFYDTRVDTSVVVVGDKRVDILFTIVEGQPMILDSLAIVGLDSVPDRDRILRDSVVKVGQRVGQLLVAAQMDTITNRLRNSGYPTAAIFRAFDTHKPEHRAELELNVQTGARAHIGTIVVNGTGVNGGPAKIDSGVVLGLLGFRRGDLYSERAIADAQQHLYDLSVYRHVDVKVDTTWAHGDSIADVVVNVREDLFKQVDSDIGWGQLDCFKANAAYTDKNFQNQARRLDLTARLSKLGYAQNASTTSTRQLCDRHLLDDDSLASSKVNDYFGATIRYPTLFGHPFTPAFSIYTQRQGQYKAFLRSTDIGVDLSATRDIARQTPFRLGYTFEHGQTKAEPVILCAIFNRCTQNEQDEVQRRLRLAIASASVSRVRTDNLIAPTRGYTAAVETRYSAPFLGSDVSLQFYKTTADVSLYRLVRRGVTFVGHARGGVILGGQSIEGARLPPPQERLYAGGGESVRGFRQNELGPQVYLLQRDAFTICRGSEPGCADTTSTFPDGTFYLVSNGKKQDRSIPTGGNLLAVFNAELRIRDPFFTDLIEYVPFVDVGQVWINQVDKNAGHQPLVVTPGLGLRYYSPVGALQVNFGYNSHPPEPGVAYFAVPFNSGENASQRRPLLCVTRPNEPPILIHNTGDGPTPESNDCTKSFAPPGGRRIVITFSVGAPF
jgi:outer membrane protein insertion porin family/translocation and assembly module TamA